jgi:hypothetical protein
LARRCGPDVISHNTVHQVLRGRKLPKLAHLQIVVAGLGGDQMRFKELWLAAKRAEQPLSADPPTESDANEIAAEIIESARDRAAEIIDSALRSAARAVEAAAAAQDHARRALAQLELLGGEVGEPPPDRSGRPRLPSDPPARGTHLAAVPELAGGPAPLADELFLLGHDPGTGRALVDADVLASGVAGAVLGELLLVGRIALADDGTVTIGEDMGSDDPIAELVVGEIVRCGAHRLPEWIRHLRSSVPPLVGQRLLDAGVVTRRPGRHMLRHIVCYPVVDHVGARRRVARLDRLLLRGDQPMDDQTRLLAALVRSLGLHDALSLELPRGETSERLELISVALPAQLRSLVAAVDGVVSLITLTPRR